MWTWLKSIIGAKPSVPGLPSGQRVYAIGDIHGHLSLLDNLLSQVLEDAQQYPEHSKTLVFLGDYVDRGPDSKGVLERLRTLDLPGFEIICLSGNHEEMLLTFLEDVTMGLRWLRVGGRETLASYGIATDAEETDIAGTQWALVKALSGKHTDFLRGLGLSYQVGDYLFVHAGIRPGRPIIVQDKEDLLWIREPFLTSQRDHGKVVVHGHSVRFDAEFYPNEDIPCRIGIDTGAYKNGVLTCLALVGKEKSLIQTGVSSAPVQ